LTILTCNATSIVVIYLNLPANMRLFTFDTNGGTYWACVWQSHGIFSTVKGQQL